MDILTSLGIARDSRKNEVSYEFVDQQQILERLKGKVESSEELLYESVRLKVQQLENFFERMKAADAKIVRLERDNDAMRAENAMLKDKLQLVSTRGAAEVSGSASAAAGSSDKELLQQVNTLEDRVVRLEADLRFERKEKENLMESGGDMERVLKEKDDMIAQLRDDLRELEERSRKKIEQVHRLAQDKALEAESEINAARSGVRTADEQAQVKGKNEEISALKKAIFQHKEALETFQGELQVKDDMIQAQERELTDVYMKLNAAEERIDKLRDRLRSKGIPENPDEESDFVQIDGESLVGQTLEAIPNFKLPSGSTIQWYRASAESPEDYLEIADANELKYLVTADDFNFTLRCAISRPTGHDEPMLTGSSPTQLVKMSEDLKREISQYLRLRKEGNEIEFDVTFGQIGTTESDVQERTIVFTKDGVKIKQSSRTKAKERYNADMQCILSADDPLHFRMNLNRKTGQEVREDEEDE